MQRLCAAADAAVVHQCCGVRQQGGEGCVGQVEHVVRQRWRKLCRIGREQDCAPAVGHAGVHRRFEEASCVAHGAARHEDDGRRSGGQELLQPIGQPAFGIATVEREIAESKRTGPTRPPRREPLRKQRHTAIGRMHPVAEDAAACGRRRHAELGCAAVQRRARHRMQLVVVERAPREPHQRPGRSARQPPVRHREWRPVAAQHRRRGVRRDQRHPEALTCEACAEHRRWCDDGARVSLGRHPTDEFERGCDRWREHAAPEHAEPLDRVPQVRVGDGLGQADLRTGRCEADARAAHIGLEIVVAEQRRAMSALLQRLADGEERMDVAEAADARKDEVHRL